MSHLRLVAFEGKTAAKINMCKLIFQRNLTMLEVQDIKREVETLSHRLGKTQDYL